MIIKEEKIIYGKKTTSNLLLSPNEGALTLEADKNLNKDNKLKKNCKNAEKS